MGSDSPKRENPNRENYKHHKNNAEPNTGQIKLNTHERDLNQNININLINQMKIESDKGEIIRKNENLNLTNKYSDNELFYKMTQFLESYQIKDLVFTQNKSNDQVFIQINAKEKEELIKYLGQKKPSFINEIKNYLASNDFAIPPKLSLNLILKENGQEILARKINNEINEINNNENAFKINYLTIMVIGKSGVGKSALINSVLKLAKGKGAEEGVGDIVTQKIGEFTSSKIPYLRLIDTRGIETNTQFGPERITQECTNFIKGQYNTGDTNNFVHCIWFCFKDIRFEETEFQSIEKLKKAYSNAQIPIIIVNTLSLDEKESKKMKKYIRQRGITNPFVRVLARKKLGKESFGLRDLIETTVKVCKEAINGDMHSVMTKDISGLIEKNLKEENLRIVNCINENNILDFTEGYNDVKNDKEFQDYTINLYGKNINYFLEKDLSRNGYEMIKNSNLINGYNTSFINFYNNTIQHTISNDLKQLAYEGLAIQADLERKNGKPTLMENKRGLNEFFNENHKFLKDNLSYWAQKLYLSQILTNNKKISKYFKDDSDNLIHDLLDYQVIKDNISALFIRRFEDLEQNISKIDLEHNDTESTYEEKNAEDDDVSSVNSPNKKKTYNNKQLILPNQYIQPKENLKGNNFQNPNNFRKTANGGQLDSESSQKYDSFSDIRTTNTFEIKNIVPNNNNGLIIRSNNYQKQYQNSYYQNIKNRQKLVPNNLNSNNQMLQNNKYAYQNNLFPSQQGVAIPEGSYGLQYNNKDNNISYNPYENKVIYNQQYLK